MFKKLIGVVTAIFTGIAAAVNSLRSSAPIAAHPGWQWTVKVELGTSISEINDLFKMHMQGETIKAGQFALHVNGILAISTAYTWGEPSYAITQPDSVMRIASCSKAFTTAAILDLIHKGALTGQEKVFSFLGITENDPSVSPVLHPADPHVNDITVQHLVKHSGGWNYVESPNDWVFRLKDIGRGMR